MIKFILAAFLLITSLGQPGHAAAGPPAGPAPLNGQWKGPLKLLGGKITLYITIVPLSNGSYYAALDAPQQRISRMSVAVEVQGDDLTLRIEQAGSRFVGKVLNGGASLSGTWTQPGLTAPLVLVRAAAQQAATRLRAAPPYRETDITFLNSTTREHLSGTVTVPAGEGPFPGVVLLSDLGPQGRDAEVSGYRMFGQLADYLTRHGIAVLRFDDRGVGKSEGTYATATTADLVTDAQAALACLRAQPLVSGGRVGLVGYGEGANVALLTAGAPSGRAPAFVVSLAGYGEPGYDVLLRQQSEIMRLIGADPSQVKAAQEAFARTVGLVRQTANNTTARARVTALLSGANTGLDAGMARARAAQLTSPWSRYFFDFNPQNRLAQVQCPVLLLNGTEDLQVSVRQNMTPLQKALNRAHNPATAQRLAGVNHLFETPTDQWTLVDGAPQPTFSPEALKNIREWVALQTRLPGAPLPVTVKRAAPHKPVRYGRARG